MNSVSIVGVGRMGGAIAIALSRNGFRLDDLIYKRNSIPDEIAANIVPMPPLRSIDSPRMVASDVLLITTPDAEIAAVAESMASLVSPSTIVLHMSGALSSLELSAFRDRDTPVGSMHPLVAISDPAIGADSFSGTYFCLEGDRLAIDAAGEIIARLEGFTFTVDTSLKSLYHAGAVMAAGHLVTLIDAAIGVLSSCGIERAEARKILMPLVESTVLNLKKQEPAKAMTGPFARADLETIERHFRAFETSDLKEESNLYFVLGLRALELAEENGADKTKLTAIREAIMIAKRSSK